MVLGNPDIHIHKNEVGPLPYTLYKNELKIDQRPKRNIKLLENIGENSRHRI